MAVKKSPRPVRTVQRRTEPASPPPASFVPLKALGKTPATPEAMLAEIRRIYFATAAATIEADLQHAIALLRLLPDEETRERATVYMEGLNDLRKEFADKPRRTRR